MAVGYNPSLISDGLVLYLDAANTKSYSGSGTAWNDMSSRNNNGTLTNSPTYSSTNGGNFSFDGINDFVSINNSTTFNNNIGSVELWIYINSFTNADWFTYGIGSGSFAQLYIRYYGSRLDFYFGGIGKNQDYSFSGSNLTNNFPTAKWLNICVTYDNTAGAGTIYVNGSSVVTMTNATNAISQWTPAAMYLGGFTWDGYSNTRIAACRMYNVRLNASQVSQNFNALRGRFGV